MSIPPSANSLTFALLVSFTFQPLLTLQFSRYHTFTTPLNLSSLVRRLKPYNLTKTEVLNLINLNLGAKVSDEEIKQEDGEEEEVTSRDLALFRVTVEDCEERFPGEEGEERIGEVVGILKEEV